MTKRAAAPIIAAVLLLLPVLYVVSYLALVVPRGVVGWQPLTPTTVMIPVTTRYRWGGERASQFFWPLEQVDRKLRPATWQVGKIGLERQISGSVVLMSTTPEASK